MRTKRTNNQNAARVACNQRINMIESELGRILDLTRTLASDDEKTWPVAGSLGLILEYLQNAAEAAASTKAALEAKRPARGPFGPELATWKGAENFDAALATEKAIDESRGLTAYNRDGRKVKVTVPTD